jgi:hypothetical protein
VVKGCGDSGFKGTHLVFLDKNHPKDAISKVISEISQSLPGHVMGKFLYLTPMVSDSVFDLPFSLQFIVQTYARCQKRTKHETLDASDPIRLIEVQTMFLRFNLGVQFNDKFLTQHGLDGYLTVPLHNEALAVPQELAEAVQDLLNSFNGVGKSN